jgi:PAS domain S-box-containing protein
MTDELRILVLEDIASDAELIRRELRKGNLKFAFRCVATKDEFLQQLDTFKPDVIISDFSLGFFNALDALRLVHERAFDLPFILVTGSQSEEVAVACIKEGVDDYILKSSLKRLPSALLSSLKKKQAEQERSKAEKALRQSEEHFRSLIENSSDIITIMRPDGLVSYVSPSIERVLGYQPDDIVGTSAFDLVHPDDVPYVKNAFAKRGTALSGQSITYRFQHKDRSWRMIETIGKNLVHNADLAGVVLNSRDVTERLQAEEQIREQAALLDKAQDAILVYDLEDRIGFWNKSAENLYGWSAQEVLGGKASDFLDRNDCAAAFQARNTALQKGEWHGELNQVTKTSQEIIVESRWTLVCDSDGHPRSMLVINTDITEKKKLESQFLRVQRMESIGTLAGGIAHDLNNVLTPILLAIRMLRDEVQHEHSREILNTLEASAQRGSSIVQQVLSFARGVEGDRSVLQVKHPLTEVLSIVKDTFPRLIQLSSRIEKDLWPVFGDPTQLHQVFMNLFVNARDAMPQGGRLHVTAENAVLDEEFTQRMPEAKTGPHVVISISDTGFGISPELLPKIFEPFFTTKEIGKGTGLGLSTVLGLVKSHSGFVTVQSDPGQGARFTVYIPAAAYSSQSSLPASDVPEPQGNGELVLVADDEAAVRQIIQVTLEANNYRVITANDGTEAVTLLAERQKEIAMAIIDLMMPHMDGHATIRAMLNIKPALRTLAVSGLLEPDKKEELAALRQVAFLPKPFTTEQLLHSLRQLSTRPASLPEGASPSLAP